LVRFLEKAPNRLRCRRLQPCKRCAALARKRSSRSSFRLGESNLTHQRGEPRIGLQAFRFRIELEPCECVRTLLISFLEPFEGFVFVPETRVNINAGGGRNESMFL